MLSCRIFVTCCHFEIRKISITFSLVSRSPESSRLCVPKHFRNHLRLSCAVVVKHTESQHSSIMNMNLMKIWRTIAFPLAICMISYLWAVILSLNIEHYHSSFIWIYCWGHDNWLYCRQTTNRWTHIRPVEMQVCDIDVLHDDVIKWKTLSALLAICTGNPPDPVEYPA